MTLSLCLTDSDSFDFRTVPATADVTMAAWLTLRGQSLGGRLGSGSGGCTRGTRGRGRGGLDVTRLVRYPGRPRRGSHLSLVGRATSTTDDMERCTHYQCLLKFGNILDKILSTLP